VVDRGGEALGLAGDLVHEGDGIQDGEVLDGISDDRGIHNHLRAHRGRRAAGNLRSSAESQGRDRRRGEGRSGAGAREHDGGTDGHGSSRSWARKILSQVYRELYNCVFAKSRTFSLLG